MDEMADRLLDREHPWPGLMSFDEQAQDFFHGRDTETQELMRLIKRNVLTVLFGQSGLGKSSLLKAGLFPKLRQQEFLPIYIRLDIANQQMSLIDQVKNALAEALAENRIEARPPLPDETLWEYFHREDVDFWTEKNRLVVPVLALDQFEEIFTLLPRDRDNAGSDRRHQLITALAELIENRTPPSVTERLERDPDSTAEFDFSKKNCNIILGFREDFLAHFEELRRIIPSIMTNRMRLTRMTGFQALQAIEKSGGHLIEEGVADRIIYFVARGRETHDNGEAVDLDSLEVEPSLLSVVCQELNNRRIATDRPQISADLLAGHHSAIITDFYSKSTADVSTECRDFIEDHLLTDSGHRDSRALEDVLAMEGVSREAIDSLIARRLLRLEERFGVLRVELTHDLLTKVIKESRDRRIERARQAEVQRRQKQRVRRMTALGGGLAAVAIALSVAAFRFHEQAEAAKRDREKLLSYLTAMTTEVADQVRLYPGAGDLIQFVIADVEGFADRWQEETGRHEEAVDRLKANDLVLRAGAAAVHGHPSHGLTHLAEASAMLDHVADSSTNARNWIERVRLDLLLQRGAIYSQQSNYAESHRDYQEAVNLADGLVRTYPDIFRLKHRLSRALGGLANATLQDKPKDEDEAQKQSRIATAAALIDRSMILAEEQQAIAASMLRKSLADGHDGVAFKRAWVLWSREMSVVHSRRASLYRESNQLDEAEAELRIRMKMTADLVPDDPFNSRISHAFSQYQLASLLLKRKRPDEAQQLLDRSGGIIDTLADLDGQVVNWANMRAQILMTRGDVAAAEGRNAEAIERYLAAKATFQDLAGRDSTIGNAKRGIADVEEKLAKAQAKK